MKKVKLTGISRKGKNRINQFGDIWIIKKNRDFDMLLRSEKGNDRTCDLRWVWKKNDPNFEVEKIKD